MPERLYQSQLWGPLEDVTPQNFRGLEYKPRESKQAVARFVREPQEKVQVRSPTVAATYLMEHVYIPFEEFSQEEMWVLLLDTKNRITHEVMVYRGTVNTMTVRVGEILREAINVNATGIIISHNHPTGDPDPSPEDVATTKHIVEAAKLLDVEVLDHLVIGRGRWFSMKERGLGF